MQQDASLCRSRCLSSCIHHNWHSTYAMLLYSDRKCWLDCIPRAGTCVRMAWFTKQPRKTLLGNRYVQPLHVCCRSWLTSLNNSVADDWAVVVCTRAHIWQLFRLCTKLCTGQQRQGQKKERVAGRWDPAEWHILPTYTSNAGRIQSLAFWQLSALILLVLHLHALEVSPSRGQLTGRMCIVRPSRRAASPICCAAPTGGLPLTCCCAPSVEACPSAP
jgi:hypothetical protein